MHKTKQINDTNNVPSIIVILLKYFLEIICLKIIKKLLIKTGF